MEGLAHQGGAEVAIGIMTLLTSRNFDVAKRLKDSCVVFTTHERGHGGLGDVRVQETFGDDISILICIQFYSP